MKDTPPPARVWAKTGSMSNVRSLSGYVITLDGEPLVFSFMATSFQVPASRIDAAMDEALRAARQVSARASRGVNRPGRRTLLDLITGERIGRR